MRQLSIPRMFLVLMVFILISACLPAIAIADDRLTFDDIQSHWAEQPINKWVEKGLVSGYGNRIFMPNQKITRAEFVVLINRVFGYHDAAHISHSDVSPNDWYFNDIAKAANAGYLAGYPDGTVRPNSPITRQEAAAILARVFSLDEKGKTFADVNLNDVIEHFKDKAKVASWSKEAIGLIVQCGYMRGYPDGTFRPKESITRAEIISVLDRVVGTLLNRPGTYGKAEETTTIEGNVVINSPDITLRNIIITGDLYLTEGIGDGTVVLENVTVEGIVVAAWDVKAIYKGDTNAQQVKSKKRRQDRTAPVFVPGYPQVTNISMNQIELLIKANEDGVAYFVVLADGAEAPSAAQVKAGQDASGNLLGEKRKGQISFLANQEESAQITGLAISTSYDIYVVAEDLKNNLQQSVTKIDVVTGANTDASLNSLMVSAGELNFAPGTLNYYVTVPHDTPSVTVTFTAVSQADTSVESPQTVTISGGTGYFEVTVTAGDKVNTKTYTISFTEAPDNDATLSDLKVDGVTISGFAPNIYEYSMVVPYGTATVPSVSATTTDPNANAETTQATSFTDPDNVATVLVTAEDGTTTKTYTVTFTMAPPSTDATLSDLRVNDVTVPGFAADKFEYTVDVPYGTAVGSAYCTSHCGEK
ncbi:MAG: S-layer homology domain-containing protein [Peptococcia bacterium]